MNRYAKRRHQVERDDVHRWLVSYADYMTLLFALFVVLYAMAMVNDKPFESITESIGRVFQADSDKVKNKGHGEDILPVNSAKSEKKLFGNGILESAGPSVLDKEKHLVNIKSKELGSDLSTLEQQLHSALFDIIESGYAELKIEGDWLEIELNSGLLFPSGSASVTKSAQPVLNVIYDVIAKGSNYIRVRGYTDNQPIQTEVFSSNWELSVYRATAILRILERLTINPARMAIEGYGEYDPTESNATVDGRAKNRRVVIAVSKYGLSPESIKKENPIKVNNNENSSDNLLGQESSEQINVIQLDNGGIRITSRVENKK